MNKVFIICLCVLALAACKKSESGLAHVQEQAKIDNKRILDYISRNNLVATKVMIGKADTTDIWYITETKGTDSTVFTNSSLLTVGYSGRVLDSTRVFAQTDNYHPSFRLGDMIRGWQYGIPASNIKKGGKIRLLIASRYGYGPYPQESLHIPMDAVLDFEIELFDVTN